MSRRLFSAAAVLAFILIALPSSASALTSSEAKFVSLINQERKERGLSTLVVKGDLVAVARNHSARMAADGEIYHNSKLSKEVSGNWEKLGENVGKGPSVSSLHEAFMNSPTHKAIIIDKAYNQVGVGIVVKGETIYVTEVFADRPTAKKRTTVAPKKPVVQKPVVQKLKVVKKRTPAPVVAPPPRTVGVLLRLAGLDARRTDPATGRALGI